MIPTRSASSPTDSLRRASITSTSTTIGIASDDLVELGLQVLRLDVAGDGLGEEQPEHPDDQRDPCHAHRRTRR